jgi:large conductance mechanosensitive channel
MSVLKEFKEFAVKGSVVDLAVGVVIGAAFGKIVASFVEDVIMPPLGVLVGGVSFGDLAIKLRDAAGAAPPVLWKYGKFLQTCFDFAIVAFAIFIVVKAINRMKREEPAKPAAPPRQEVLLEEIRDLLKK